MNANDAKRWRDELKRFRNNPDRWTPQVRGQKFNKLLADILSRDGINAFYNQRNIGEIDVCFRVDGFRFIMEAKWETDRINIDPIAKLALRVSQRVDSNFGIFVSMSGYTAPAIEEINRAGRPNILLIDSEMVELFVSGIYSVSEIFNAMMDVASYEGNYYIQPNHLHKYIKRGYQVIDSAVDHNEEIDQRLKELFGWNYAILGSGLPFGQLGIDYFDGRVFLSLIDGVYQLDGGVLKQIVEIENPQNRPLIIGKTVYFVRNGSVMQWQEGQYKITYPAMPGHVRLFRDKENISVFSNGDEFTNPKIPTRIARYVNVEQEPKIDEYDYPVQCGVDATSDENSTAIIGSSGLVVYDEFNRIGNMDVTNGSAVTFFDNRIYFLENGHILKSCAPDCKNVVEHINLPFNPSVGDFVIVDNNHFYFQGFYSYEGISFSAIIELKASNKEAYR